MRRGLSLTQRLSALVAVLLLACGAASVALQMHAGERQAQEVIQKLSQRLAAQIVENNAPLLAPDGLNDAAVHALFDKLMEVNPSVEVYLVGTDGTLLADAAPPGHLRRDRIDLAPVREMLAGGPLPIVGDDPRSASAQKVFSVAPIEVGGALRGYIYVVLIGEDHDTVSRTFVVDGLMRTTLWSMLLVAVLGLCAGLVALRWITRPLRELTAEVQRFEAGSVDAEPAAIDAQGAAAGRPRDEIAQLRLAYAQMTQRIAAQWRELSAQDQQRREMVANISHDLRTPLTSLHGYLETLRLKADILSEADRHRYLDIAIGQSRKVGTLAQSLFELARLEHGGVRPEKEPFSLAELVQDVFQKFELAAEARRQRLVADIHPELPVVEADLGMIERVLTNLLDNAIRHTPEGGEIVVRLQRAEGGVDVSVADNGPGVPDALQRTLFTRPSLRCGWRYGPEVAGGLGLLIVQRILQLHDSDIRLEAPAGHGAVFRFKLQAA